MKRKVLAVVLTLCLAICLLNTTVMAMQIYVEVTSSGGTMTLDVEPADTIENIKQKIQDKEGYSTELQLLYYDGNLLSDGKTLADYSINKEATLQLVVLAAKGADWTLDSDGILSIYNDDGMADWTDNYRNTYGSSVESVVIDSGVTYIARFAFYNCSNLTLVTIPDSVTDIGNHAFSGCTSLASIEIPSSVKGLNEAVFEYCTSLTSITIPSSITSIGTNTFYYCTGLTSIEIPSSVTSIGQSAFSYCDNLTSVTIQNGVASIGESAFYSCSNLNSIVIPESVTIIGKTAFAYCESLTSITIPSSVTSIGSGAFCFCTGLTSVTIPDSVTTLDEYAFEACTSLESIVIGNGITTINNNTFYGCSSLESVYISSSVTSIGRVAFYPDWGVSNSILDVYYEGSSTSWNAIDISGDGNENLTDAFIHYNCTSIHISHVHGSIHEWSSDYTTCTVIIYCSECDSTKEIECTVEFEEITAVSCTVDGTAYCTATATIANEVYSETQTVVTATATGHSTETQNAKDATCTEDGYTGDEVCTVCGETITSGEVIPATSHSYLCTGFDWANDLNSATATFACTICGDTQEVAAIVTSVSSDGKVTYTATATYGNNNATGSSVITVSIPNGNSTLTGDSIAVDTTETTGVATEEEVKIDEPIEDTDTDTESDEMEVSEPETEPETNPTTGIVISLLPMAIAALAAVSSKRR